MRKDILKSVLVLFFYFPLIALGQDISISQDQKAEPVLNSVSKDFDKEKAYQVEFRYEIYSAMEDATVSDFGSVIIKGPFYKLKTEDTEVYFNGRYLWTYSLLNEEVYKSEPNEGNSDQILADPFKFLSEYKKYFKYSFKGDTRFEGTNLNKIELYPIDLENNYSIIELFTEPKNNKLYSLILKQKDGLEIRVFINDIIKNINIKDSTFEWNSENHPGVLLIEM